MTSEYKYDVAFSFLERDEALAAELNDLLQSRVRTFLYSRKQEVLAGTDGEKRFNAVFASEARLVVVLYRVGWGESPWTRIEQTAIRNRGYDNGYDFVKFIPLDDPPSVPNWLPRAQLWIGLTRWGTAGAAGVIEARVQELGGEPHEESVADKAVRVDRSIKFAEKRKQFLRSFEGVNAANTLYESLKQEVQLEIANLNTVAPSFEYSFKSNRKEFAILGRGPALLVYWNYHAANSLDDAHLEITLWLGHPPWPGVRFYDPPKKLQKFMFTFELMPSDEHCWISNDNENRTYSSKALASYLLSYSIEQADKYKQH